MTDTLWQRWTRGGRRLRQRPDWPLFAGPGWADDIMGRDVTDCFHAKEGRSTGRLVLRADGKQLAVYLKRHHHLPWWLGMLAALWPDAGWSPAMEEWQRLELARAAGLPVPRTVATGEFIGPWGRLESFLAVEELTGMLPLHEAIPAARRALAPRAFASWKRGLVAEVARLSRELHARRWFHKDLYLCHFFIPRSALGGGARWRGLVHLIDLHRLTQHGWTWPLWQLKDLAQLLYSSEVAGVTARDRLRFWRAYGGPVRRRWWTRLAYRVILFKSGRYRQHNEKKRLLELTAGLPPASAAPQKT
jgi:Lipopolysaccharide kinase (Kdo/WaaP) family